jgi:hypothetical protein
MLSATSHTPRPAAWGVEVNNPPSPTTALGGRQTQRLSYVCRCVVFQLFPKRAPHTAPKHETIVQTIDRVALHRPEFFPVERLVRGKAVLEPVARGSGRRGGDRPAQTLGAHAGTPAAPADDRALGAYPSSRWPASGPSLPGVRKSLRRSCWSTVSARGARLDPIERCKGNAKMCAKWCA